MNTSQAHLLIIKHGALGDIILATGAMKAIRARHPEARITLLTTRPYDALMADCPYIDEILIDPKPKIWQWSKIKQLKALLQKHRWQWVYDLQTSQRSTTYFPLLNTEFYSGLSPKGSHPHLTPERTSLHTLDRIAQQMQLAGIDETPAPDVSWLGAEPPVIPDGKYILLVAGGAPHRPEKRWPTEYYSELAKQLNERSFNVILIGTKAEEAILEQIAKADDRIINLMGQTSFAQIASLARGASYAVGNDTGPMHLIAAAGCPCTVIFNTTASNPEKSAPRGKGVSIEQSDDLQTLTVDFIAKTVITAL